MGNQRSETIVEKLFTKWTLLLGIFGLVVNLVLSKLVIYLGLPLYLDNVGSIIAAALGGVLPGIVVGFLSNFIGSVTDPISMYYGIITVLIAYFSARFSQGRQLSSWRSCLRPIGFFVLLGGGLGSIFTWLLYGSQISGLAAPYATTLNEMGIPAFLAQLLVDLVIDIPDKILTVALAYLALKNYPSRLYDLFPLSYIYDRPVAESVAFGNSLKTHYSRVSIHTRIIRIVLVFITIVSLISIAIGSVYHHLRLFESYAVSASGIARTCAKTIDGNNISSYIENGRAAEGYKTTEKRLREILDSNPKITYLYVYKILPGSCQVVFDFDTPSMPGQQPGDVLVDEQGFKEHMDAFEKGEAIEPEFSSGPYGMLLTAYEPVKDSRGVAQAYVGVDIALENYLADMLTYIIQVLSVLFGLSVVIASFALWYIRKEITEPINSIMDLSRSFDATKPEDWLISPAWLNRVPVKTGDELEALYTTTCRVEENVVHYVKRLTETEAKLQASKELERVNRELAVAVKRADEARMVKSEFYSRMSHDMRTPMNGIIGLVNLSKHEEDVQVLHQNMEKINTASNYLLGLINDTLDMSKMESEKLTLAVEPVSLKTVMADIYAMIKPSLEQKQLQYSVTNVNIPKGQVVLTDEMRFKQIIMNLLSNSIKFTTNGGSISVCAEQTAEEEGRVWHKIKINDNGLGMSSEFIENQIFQPFNQERNAVTREYAGTGLGLAIVKNLVELMGGSINVESGLIGAQPLLLGYPLP